MADIRKEFDSEPVYNKEFLKSKIKSHGDEVKDYYDKAIPKFDSNQTFLTVISLNSSFKEECLLGSNFENVFWMLEQPVNNKVFSKIQFLLWEFYQEY